MEKPTLPPRPTIVSENERELKEALHAINRVYVPVGTLKEEARDYNDLIKARDIIWDIGQRRYGWQD